ncbi:GNAT family N-acetyltransferase [Haloferax namakaokahaiae]|uniref:GNAT family N-acetyltransferase n=1 Tax=Haloferax namakaokahaiae TaxID=1748331 RepID=A0ABD5Z9Q2_9EURY
MEFAVLGWPADGPRLRLDYRRFTYAGKFITTKTGKAVLSDPEAPLPPLSDERPPPADGPEHLGELRDDVLAAVAFNEDRTDSDTLWIRYITVRRDRRGEGLGPVLLSKFVDAAAEYGYDRLRIATNNPFAYEACHKAGFGFTGRETGLAELVLERPTDRPASVSKETYQSGLDRYRARDLGDDEHEFLASRKGADPPVVADE